MARERTISRLENRTQGQTYNVWQNLKNSTRTGQSPWIYPEFKGYFDDVSWLQLDTAEGKITVGTKEEKMFVRLFDFTEFMERKVTQNYQAEIFLSSMQFRHWERFWHLMLIMTRPH